MAHFAKINEKNIVVDVIVAEQEFINTGVLGDPSKFIQTSYNTRSGKHPNNTPLRKNYAAIGYYYDSALDAFIPPKPHASWILNEETGSWRAPAEYPKDGAEYQWDESDTLWVKANP